MTTYGYHTGAMLVSIQNVCVRFGPQVVLKDVNAEVRKNIADEGTRGQVVGFLGPSGCGKTTLVRILAGLQQPTSGLILLAEKHPVHAGAVGLVSQDYYVFPHRTVRSNLVVAARQHSPNGTDPATAEQRAEAVLERFQLADQATHYPAQLSGGQRQRLAIAQQLLCSEHYLLMDEPFSGLDPVMVDCVVALIREVADTGDLTIIVVTHDISSAVAVADHLWLMGRDRDVHGQPVPGARLQTTYDLIERGLAWHPNVRGEPGFAPLVLEIRDRFRSL